MKKRIITLLIGILALGSVLYFLGFEKIIFILSRTNLSYFLLAALGFLCVEFFAALKFSLISRLKISQLFLSHTGGMFLSQLTPGKAGYIYASYSLAKKEGGNISGKVGLVSLIQGLMMALKIVLIILALVYFSFLFEIPNYLFLSFIMPVIIVSLVIFLLYSKKSKKILSRIPVLKKGLLYLELMQKAVNEVSLRKAIGMIGLDLISWFFWGVQFYFLAAALGISLSFITCLMLQPLLTAVLFIPVSPNALGLAESGNALVFTLLGSTPEVGVAFILLFRLNTLFVDSIGIIDLKTVKVPKKINII